MRVERWVGIGAVLGLFVEVGSGRLFGGEN